MKGQGFGRDRQKWAIRRAGRLDAVLRGKPENRIIEGGGLGAKGMNAVIYG